MVRVSSVVSDTQSTNEATTSGAQGATKAIGESPGPNKDNDAQADDGEAGGDEEESEYEIEAIIDAKRGAFPEVRPSTMIRIPNASRHESSTISMFREEWVILSSGKDTARTKTAGWMSKMLGMGFLPQVIPSY